VIDSVGYAAYLPAVSAFINTYPRTAKIRCIGASGCFRHRQRESGFPRSEDCHYRRDRHRSSIGPERRRRNRYRYASSDSNAAFDVVLCEAARPVECTIAVFSISITGPLNVRLRIASSKVGLDPDSSIIVVASHLE
jgi:hypothetical protein